MRLRENRPVFRRVAEGDEQSGAQDGSVVRSLPALADAADADGPDGAGANERGEEGGGGGVPGAGRAGDDAR